MKPDSKVPMRLLGGVTLMLFGVAGFLAYYLMQRQEQLAVNGIHDKAGSFSEMLSLSAAAGLEYDDKQYVLDIFGTMQADRDLVFVRVLREDGTVFAGFVPGVDQPSSAKTAETAPTEAQPEAEPELEAEPEVVAEADDAPANAEGAGSEDGWDDEKADGENAAETGGDDGWAEEGEAVAAAETGAESGDDGWAEEGDEGVAEGDALAEGRTAPVDTRSYTAGLTVPSFDLSNGQETQTQDATIFVGQFIRNKDGKVIGQAQMAFSLKRVNEAVAAGVRVITIIVISTLFACAFAFLLALKFEKAKKKAFKKVQDMAARVAKGNEEMRLVMDNVDQGFITLNADGEMSEERSAVVDTWFGSFSAGMTLWDYLQRMNPDFAIALEMHWDELKDPFMPIWCHVEQLPRHLKVGSSTFEFAFTALEEDETLQGMLVVITDITEQLKHLRFEAEQKETVRMLEAIMKDRSGFLSFHTESTDVIDALCEGGFESDPAGLSRAVHTLKGNSSLYDLATVSGICHSVEEQIKENQNLSKELNELRERWESLTDTLKVFGVAQGQDQGLQIEREEYEKLVEELSQSGADALLQRVQGWDLEAANVSLSRLTKKAEDLATRLAKGDLNTRIIADDSIRFDNAYWGGFWSELAHVIRNAVDHGMDSVEDRVALGKPPKNTLTVSAEILPEEGLVVRIADDGAGINWDRVAAKARDKGLPAKTRDDLIAVLFEQGFSTRDEASALSGRGVGMAAVWEITQKLGGTISVASEIGEGTTWTFSFRHPSYMLCSVPELSCRQTSVFPKVNPKDAGNLHMS